VIFCLSTFWQLVWNQLLQTSVLEWFGTITGFLCVYLAARQHILNWPVAIFSIIAYVFLFFEYKLYGDALLQLYFLGTSIYGWYYWLKRKENHQKPIVSLNKTEYAGVLIVITVLSFLIGAFLDRFTDSDVPYIDGACTAGSFVAQFLMTRKIIQNWVLWIVIDICYVPLYLYKDLALTAILYTLYLGLATMGYLDWRRTWKQSK